MYQEAFYAKGTYHMIKSVLFLLVIIICTLPVFLAGCENNEATTQRNEWESDGEFYENEQDSLIELMEYMQEPVMMRGTWEDNIYTNFYLGLRILIPDEHFLAIRSDRELADMMQIDESVISNFSNGIIPDSFWDIDGGQRDFLDTYILSETVPGQGFMFTVEYVKLSEDDQDTVSEIVNTLTPVQIGDIVWYIETINATVGILDHLNYYSIADEFVRVISFSKHVDAELSFEEMSSWITAL